MVRKLTLAAAGALAFCSSAFGLGLGDLQLKSSLNQTFNASIDLRDTGGLNSDEVVVKLGAAEDFTRAGLDRPGFLQDFHFSVQMGSNGRGVVKVTSGRPITEPFVEFLVSVQWPTGRMQRQYTVLLDPPHNEVLRPSAVSPASGGSRPPRSPKTPDDKGNQTPDAARRPESDGQAPGFTGSEYGPVANNDTLWRVASRVRPSNAVSVRQTMLALLHANPDAFIGNNINRLKAGATLHVPGADEIQKMPATGDGAQHRRASVGSGRHHRVAQSGTPVTSAPANEAPSAPAPTKDEVRIVTPPAAKPGQTPAPAPTAGTHPAPGADALAGSEEERDRLSRELAQATTSVTALQQQNQALNNKITASDQQLAELSRQLQELKANGGAAAPAAKAPGLFDTSLGKLLIGGLLLLLIGALALLAMWDKARKRAQQAERDKAASDERLERTIRMERERTGNTQRGGIPVAQQAAPAAAAAAVSSLASPAAPRAPQRAPMPEPSLDLTNDGLSRTAELTDFNKTVILADPGAEARRAAADAATSDVVSEADIYIAYGRFPQAISFLQSALEKEPNRNDARLKLMEAYAETRDAAAFQLEAQQLLSRSPGEAELRRARQLQARLPGVSVIPSEQLVDQPADFDKTIIDTSMADQALQETLNSASVELDLDLDRTDLLADVDAPKPLDLDLSGGTGSDSGKLDFDLTLDGLDESPLDDRRDQLGGDLGMDFRDDRSFDPDSTARSDKKAGDDDLGLDLTLDGRNRKVEPVKRTPGVPDDDTGLNLTLDPEDAVKPTPRSAGIAALDTVEGSPVDDDLEDFLAGDTDEARTKLDLARAYIDMGDEDGARDVLNEVLAEGSEGQKNEARELIARLS